MDSLALLTTSLLTLCWGVQGYQQAGMPINHFKAILSYLHLSDNSKAVPRNQPGHDHLHTIRPMMDCFRQTWRTFYNPPREQSIDEAMVGFKNRNAMKQYMPMKPSKRGFKVWCQCSPNGITSDCQVYKGPLRNHGRQTSALLLFLGWPSTSVTRVTICITTTTSPVLT